MGVIEPPLVKPSLRTYSHEEDTGRCGLPKVNMKNGRWSVKRGGKCSKCICHQESGDTHCGPTVGRSDLYRSKTVLEAGRRFRDSLMFRYRKGLPQSVDSMGQRPDACPVTAEALPIPVSQSFDSVP